MDVQSLIDMCTRKLSQDPNHQRALLLRASSNVKKQDYDLALKDIQFLISLNKKNSAAFYLMGCIFEKMNYVNNN